MTLNIEIKALKDDYRIISDSLQLIVQRKHIVDPTLSPNYKPSMDATKRIEYRDWKYCGSISQVADVLLKKRILESDATTLRQLRDEITAFKRQISDLLDE